MIRQRQPAPPEKKRTSSRRPFSFPRRPFSLRPLSCFGGHFLFQKLPASMPSCSYLQTPANLYLSSVLGLHLQGNIRPGSEASACPCQLPCVFAPSALLQAWVPAACSAVKGPARSATGNYPPRCLPLTALPPAGMGQTTGQRGTPALRPASNNLCQAPFSPKVDGFRENG